MVEERDKGYRLLFSYPEMVRWLLRRFLPGPWLARVDLSRLEKVSERDVSPELIRREKDLLWRLPFIAEDDFEIWFYVYLHFEFQSEPEPLIAVREMTYKGLLYLDLERQGALLPSGKLPPVLSLVVYNGEREWREKLSVSELIEPLPGPLPIGFAPDSYLVIDEQSYSPGELEREANPVTLFQAEQSREIEDLRRAASRLNEQLRGSKYKDLRRSFAVVFREVLIPAVAPGLQVPEVRGLTEVASMLQQRVIEWRDGWIAEGRLEGETRLLSRQLTKKFGSLPDWARTRIESAEADQLLEWAERVLTAETLEEIFS